MRMVTNLTSDLDEISERLFSLTTNGGEEYCGFAIDRSIRKLAWSESEADLKMIFIAGNEPFSQGTRGLSNGMQLGQGKRHCGKHHFFAEITRKGSELPGGTVLH